LRTTTYTFHSFISDFFRSSHEGAPDSSSLPFPPSVHHSGLTTFEAEGGLTTPPEQHCQYAKVFSAYTIVSFSIQHVKYLSFSFTAQAKSEKELLFSLCAHSNLAAHSYCFAAFISDGIMAVKVAMNGS
jgi:hypothetical protein